MDNKYDEDIDESSEEVKKNSVFKEIISWIETIVIAVVCAFIITRVVIVNAVIPSGSMEKTIMTGDRIIASRINYYVRTPERYEIAVFKYPDNPSTLYIKRTIGLPGETVNILNNDIYINDSTEPLIDSFVNGDMVTRNAVYKVPKKGDSLEDYKDFISDTNIYDADGDGLFDEDCYFMMGDNRNNSADSRAWANTFVPESFMEGKAIFRYYPFNDMKVIKNDF